jgi:hypothetical protein
MISSGSLNAAASLRRGNSTMANGSSSRLWHRFPPVNFLDSVVEPADRDRVWWGGEARPVGHESAPVARACSPAYWLGSPRLTWLPQRIGAWACATCSRHIHGAHAEAVLKPDLARFPAELNRRFPIVSE